MGRGWPKIRAEGVAWGDLRDADAALGLLKFVSKIIRSFYMPLEGPSEEP